MAEADARRYKKLVEAARRADLVRSALLDGGVKYTVKWKTQKKRKARKGKR